MRVILTLLIEGGIFFMFDYRKKKSWTAFFIINLITQTILNIFLNVGPMINYYLIVYLILAEIFVFIFEMITFAIFVKEHSVRRRIGYVLIANFSSLILGAVLISRFPI